KVRRSRCSCSPAHLPYQPSIRAPPPGSVNFHKKNLIIKANFLHLCKLFVPLFFELKIPPGVKTFNVPVHYRSPLVTAVKNKRKKEDKLKKDFSPTVLKISDELEIMLARHFGFCYGVENAIEIAFRAVSENPGKNIYLLSEMIHNPQVNADLEAEGVKFIMDTYGRQIIDWEEVGSDDIVIIPAFGTTLKIEQLLQAKGIRS